MPLLFPTPSVWASADWDRLGITPSANVFNLSKDHPAKYLCCTLEAVEKYVLHPEVPPDVSGDRFRDILSQMMIRRTLASRVPFDSPRTIGSEIPPVQRKVIHVQYQSLEQQMYDEQARIHKHRLFTISQTDPSRFVWNMKKLRKLILLTTWLAFHYLEGSLHAKAVPVLCSEVTHRQSSTSFHTGHRSEKNNRQR